MPYKCDSYRLLSNRRKIRNPNFLGASVCFKCLYNKRDVSTQIVFAEKLNLPAALKVVSGFFGVLASIQFKQFDELSAAENVLFVFPNELRKGLSPRCYQMQATCRKWRCYNFPVTAYIQVFEFESMYPSPVQIYVPYRGVSSPS